MLAYSKAKIIESRRTFFRAKAGEIPSLLKIQIIRDCFHKDSVTCDIPAIARFCSTVARWCFNFTSRSFASGYDSDNAFGSATFDCYKPRHFEK